MARMRRVGVGMNRSARGAKVESALSGLATVP